jgi:hypothetical protein
MDSRRQTVTHSAATFSIVAHEALDHIVVDGDNDDHFHDHARQLTTQQRCRRRLGVSR